MTRIRIGGRAAGHKTETEPVEEAICARCGGSAIDPEDSHPGAYGGYYEEPPALEPCRECVKPEQEPTQD